MDNAMPQPTQWTNNRPDWALGVDEYGNPTWRYLKRAGLAYGDWNPNETRLIVVIDYKHSHEERTLTGGPGFSNDMRPRLVPKRVSK